MKVLDNVVKLSGLNQGDVTSTLIKRENDLCLYRRSDYVYEVFYVNTNPAQKLPSGKSYPERESYPSNEDFGKTAWCYNNEEKAVIKFNQLVSQR